MNQLQRIAEALAAYDRGWWLTPVKGKRPILPGWSELPKPTRAEVLAWATAGDVGVRLGMPRRADGLVLGTLDVDPGAPPEFWNAWETHPSLYSRTPRGGLHGFFWVPPGLRNSASKLAPHVDIRAQGGQVVLYGNWIGVDGPESPLPEIQVMPQEWLDKLGSAGKLSRAAGAVANAPEGTRNDTLNREAWKLRPDIAAGKINEDEARERLAAASPLPSREVASTLDSALSVRVTRDERRILAPGIHAGNLVSTSLDFTARVLRAVPADRLYLRSGILGEVVGARWVPVLPHRLRGIVDEFVEVKWLKDRGERGIEETNGHITDEHAKLVIANAEATGVARNLKALCSHPVITRDFSVLGPGWHNGILVIGCEIASPISPMEFISDFPLDAHSQANLLSLVTSVMVRPALGGGNSPIFISTAPQPRVGKTFLQNAVVGGILLGGPIPADTWPDDKDEVRKLLLAAAMSSTSLYMIDNVPSKLDCPPLASFNTAPKVAGRLLGATKWVEVDNNITILANGNHVTASEEIARRAVTIEFLPLGSDPDVRTGFKHADLTKAVLDARAGLLGWFCALTERRGASKLVLGGFEPWCASVGSLLHEYPVLANRARHIEVMAESADDVAPLVAAIITVAPEQWLSTREVLAIAATLEWGGDALDPIRSERSRLTALGMALRHYVGRRWGAYRLVRQLRHSTAYWKVEGGTSQGPTVDLFGGS